MLAANHLDLSRRRAARRCLPLLLLPLVLPILGCPPRIDERARAYTEDGLELFQRGDYLNARESFEAALEKQPGEANLIYNVGQCYDLVGKTDKAEEYYRLCLRQSTNHANCRHALTVLLLRTGRRDAADQMVVDWLTAEPELADAYAEDGWRLRQRGDLQAAQARFQQALHRDRNNVRARIELGLLYEGWQLPERALILYQEALAVDPKQPELAARIQELRAKGVGRPKPN